MNDKEDFEFDEPPGQPVPAPWLHISAEQWQDWRWQAANRLRTVEDFSRLIHLTPEEIEGLSSPKRFHVGVTPYFASLMDPDDPHCPIRQQVIPTQLETVPFDEEMADSLNEDAHSPVPGLVHRYPDRVLMLVTMQCASYCRFCTRNRIVGTTDNNIPFNTKLYTRQLAYIAAHSEVRDVLISGGDPLMMSERVLEHLLQQLHAIPHVEIVRIGSRAPVFLPQRITGSFVAMLAKYHPLWMNIHFNHPQEITPEVEIALARLANAGIPLGSQTVLLAGINDCPNIMKALMHKLVRNRVRPYYLYQCDMVQGAWHFRTPVAKGLEIMESLRGHTSGFAIPTFVIDAPEGGGKVPILPNYLLSMSDTKVVVRNYEGFITGYAQPRHYESHNPETCPYCQELAGTGSQTGVAAVLSGQEREVAPDGWYKEHTRRGNT